MKITTKLSTLLATVTLLAMHVSGQPPQHKTDNDIIVVEPLFEYPLPPDTMSNLQARADYLVDNFWTPMDFKNKSTVDQNALNDAFVAYTTAMRFADGAKVETSVDKLISKIEKNPALSLQFAKAAEESLYGDRATVWNDRIYLSFIDNVLRNKQIKTERKLRYQRLRTILNNTLQGTVPPQFDYETADGRTAHYSPNGVITVIEFGDPDCDDCRMAKLRMDTDVTFSTLVDKGKVNVLFINVNPEDGWQEELKDYPSNWHVGAREDIDEIYDIRQSPAIYVIDREGKVAAKLVSVETAMQIAAAAAEQ